MIKTLKIISIALAYSFAVSAQVPKKRLPQNINVPIYSHIFPSLSGDGNQMIYLTNYTNSEGFETKYTYKIGSELWADPEPIPSINRPGQDHIGSFCLSYDGNFVVFSSRRTPGIGNYDIWISEKTGNSWSAPINPGKPLNSPTNEGNPSLSPDGKSLYFMRCQEMDNTKKRNCSLFVSHRISSTKWSEPTALPDYINLGHETTPRIQADNKSLIFASSRSGGKGLLDLYLTTFENETWSKPLTLSFINTAENDEFVSIPARGDIIYFSGKYRDQYNIYKAIIPEEFRTNKVLMFTGKVAYDDGKKPSEDVLIQAFDLSTGKIFTSTKLKQSDDSYTIFLPEGTSYDVSAFPQKGGHSYFAKVFDLTTMEISRREELPISLLTISAGSTILINSALFEEYSSVLTNESEFAIKRIIGFLKKNPGFRVEIGAFLDEVITDTIPSDDLTEVIADTVFFQVQKEALPLYDSSQRADTLDMDENILEDLGSPDSLLTAVTDSIEVAANEMEFETIISPKDSIITLGFELFDETETLANYFKVNYTYHNDRTQNQAEAILNRLLEFGVPENLLEAKGYGDEWIENLATEEKSYWIELKIVE